MSNGKKAWEAVVSHVSKMEEAYVILNKAYTDLIINGELTEKVQQEIKDFFYNHRERDDD